MARTRRTLLIVDDCLEDCETYRRYLHRDREFDYQIITAAYGSEGLALWQQHQPDAVLLDYNLPDFDGIAFLNALHAQGQRSPLPLIVLTGEGNEEIAVQVMKAGAQDYLVKGKITSDGLRIAVKGVMQTVQLQTQLQQRIEQEQILAQISQKIARSLDLDEILHTLTEEVRQLLQTDRVVVFKLEPDGNGTVVAESVGGEWRSVLSEQVYDPCFVETYLDEQRKGSVKAKPDIYDGSVDPCHVELLAQFQVRANLVLPILHEDQFWGVLIAHHCSAPRQWQPSEIDFLQQLTSQASIAIRQADLYQQARRELAERKRQEEALRASEEFKNRVLESSTDCIKVLSLEARLLYMNEGGMCLMEIDDLTPFINSEWACFWHGEDHQKASAAIAAAKSGAIGRFQGFCPTRKGTPKWWDVVVTPIRDHQGNVIQFLSVSRDITTLIMTEQRLSDSEAQLQLGVQVAGVALARIDYHSNTVELSPEAAAMYGMLADESTVSRDRLHATFHPGDRELLAQHIEQLLNPLGSGWFALDHRVVLPSGAVRWLSVRKQIFFDDSNPLPCPTHGILAAIDITDRKQIELEQQRVLQIKQTALAEAERVNRVKDEFLAVLSHELRSPLNPILGWTKLLQSRRLDETRTLEALATIERNAKTQGQLIDDLLDMARVLRGKLLLNVAPVRLLRVVEAAIETVRTAALSKSLQLCPSLADVGYLDGDDVRLQQIAWNLLSNAVKFTPNGGRIEIQLEQVGNQARLIVSDTGKGISPDFLPHIFDSFRQEDTSVTRHYGGLGLGMAIVYQLVQAHGGTIRAESSGEGQGATFTVLLPIRSNTTALQDENFSSEQTLDLTGIRVLAIDDEPDNREILTAILDQAGATVNTVASAADFLVALATEQPDIIVSDIGMPEIDGYTLLRQVRSLPPEKGGQIPAIALTAYAGERDQKQALAAGFQKHIAKPIEPNQIVSVIATLTQRKREQPSP